MAVVDPKEAEAVMLKAGLKPLEQYKSAISKWKCECLQCGEIVFPAYNMIKRGQGGCRPCGYLKAAKKLKKLHAEGFMSYGNRTRLNEDQAVALAKKHGRIPLEPYVNSRHAWKSECKNCKTVGYPPLSLLRQRGNSCSVCGRSRSNDAKKLSQEEVKKIFRQAGVELLVDYPYQNDKPLKCRCLRCNRIVTPSYANAKKHKEGCKHCGGTYVDPKDAEELMLKNGFKPLVKYPGTDVSWKCLHIKCGSICHPRYGTIKRGHGGCRNCAEWGFSNDKPSYLYLITHIKLNAHKIGVANQAKLKKSDRVHRHQKDGWEVHRIWQFEDGASVLQIEGEVIKMLRKELKLPQYLYKGQMKYQGETETVDSDLISLLELEIIINKVIKGLKK